MLRPSMQTLKHIVVNIHVYEDDDHPLLGIPSELEEMRTNNVIETVTIRIIVQADARCSQGNDWNRLDEVLTTPGWCSLKRVSLAIEIDGIFDITDELESEVAISLLKLPETQFLRLSSSNSVSFDFKFKVY